MRSTLHGCIPNGSFVQKEGLLREVSRELGYSKLGHNIRSITNRMIGAEVRAGRLGIDWQKVWRTTGPAKDTENVRESVGMGSLLFRHRIASVNVIPHLTSRTVGLAKFAQ